MNKKILYWVGGIIAVAGLGVGIYFLTKKTKEQKSGLLPEEKQDAPKDVSTSEQKGGGTTQNPSGCSPLDYTQQISPVSRHKTIQNKAGKMYNLGQIVVIKDKQTIFRRDKNGCSVGKTTTDNRKELGTIWHINPSGDSLVIKAKPSFAYPFYAVRIDNIE